MSSSQPEPTYTVFIRLPFPRGDFVDPPPVNWDSSKDEALWNILSGAAKTEIDWNELANRFQVTVDFLLQQVAWVTERQTSQIRAQLRKAKEAKTSSAAPSPIPAIENPYAAEAMRRTGSGGGQQRAPSSLSVRKDSPLPRNSDGSIPGTPMRSTPRPLFSRNSSANTTVLTQRNLAGSGKSSIKTGVNEPQRKRLSSLPITTAVDDAEASQDPLSPDPADSSSAASSSSSSSPAQSRIIRRPPRFQSNDTGSPDADDDDSEPAFLPYRAQADGRDHDLSATLRGDPRELARRAKGKERAHHSHTSDSSASSSPYIPKGQAAEQRRPSGPLSPRRTAELAGRSPAGKGKGYSRDSDETPSMGSSFSDLDDASVTQSALEEALASKMQDGAFGSRMSTISQAIKSRYLPKSKNA